MLLSQFEPIAQFEAAGVEVLRTQADNAQALRDEARSQLKGESEVQFAGRALVEPRSRNPVIYTENLFVKFQSRVSEAQAQGLIERYGLSLTRRLDFARNAYFLRAAEGTGLAVFELAEQLLSEGSVELCHPELVRRLHVRQVDARPNTRQANAPELPKVYAPSGTWLRRRSGTRRSPPAPMWQRPGPSARVQASPLP